MNNFYMQNLAIDGAGSVEEKLHNYNGTFTSTSLNSKYFRLDKKAMAYIVKQANEGVQVYPGHRVYNNPIGKFTNAYVYGEKGHGNFFVQEDIMSANSNDIINLMDSGVMDAMSIGIEMTDKSIAECDTCGNGSRMKMKYSWFFAYLECDEGHYLGKRLKDDTRVTATFKGEWKLNEVSVVAKGADPNAQVIKKLQEGLQDGTFDHGTINYFSEVYNLDILGFKQSLGIEPSSEPKLFTGIDLPNKEEKPMATPTDTTALQASLEELNNKVVPELRQQVETLTEERDARPTQEMYDEVESQLETTKAELALKEKEGANTDADLKSLAEDGKYARKLEQTRGHQYLKEYFGDNYREHPDALTHIQSLDNESSTVGTLKSVADACRSLAISRRPTGKRTRFDEDTPQLSHEDTKPAGYPN